MPPSKKGRQSPEAQRRINYASAVCVPVFVVGFASYVTWVNVDLVCNEYMLHPEQYFPGHNIPRRTGAAITILVLHFFFLSAFLACYTRVIQTIISNPGFIGPAPDRKPRNDMQRTTFVQSCSANTVAQDKEDSALAAVFDRHAILSGKVSLPAGAERIWSKDAFISDFSGLPNYCDQCRVYKPDRSHHSTDVGRCTRRMDHFCPWVGGMVSERNFKFFYQFLVSACCFSILVLVVMTYVYSDRRHTAGPSNGHLVASIAIGAVFTLFTVSMVLNTGYMITIGVTTVENLDRYRRVYHIAVLIPPTATYGGHMITYPLSAPPGTLTRTFAVLETPQGARPWHLGALRNWRDLMGHSFLDWVLPVRHSPFCTRDRTVTEYQFGPILQQVKDSAGLVAETMQT